MTKLTQGQKLVGLTFNPSGDDRVTRLKQVCATAIDNVLEELGDNETKNHFVKLAVDHLITAQMFGVKAQTWKE